MPFTNATRTPLRSGRAFDSDVKRFRFTSSVVYDASSFIEMITPFYPQRFLLLATIANVGGVRPSTHPTTFGPFVHSFVHSFVHWSIHSSTHPTTRS